MLTLRTSSGAVTGQVTVVQAPASRKADFNNDGSLDLLLFNPTDGSLAVWLLHGTTLMSTTALTPGTVPDTAWAPATLTDVDGDGQVDILWRHTDGRFAEWRMHGTAMFFAQRWPEALQVADPGWKLRATGDFDRNGVADFVWQHDATGNIALWRMDRYQPLIAGGPLGPGTVSDTGWKVAGSADFDADASPDLVWQHDDGRIAIWKMQGQTLVSGTALGPGQVSDTNWKIASIGDIDGNGTPDLIWQHLVTGDVAAWIMDGTRQVSGTLIGRLPDPTWRIVGPR